MIAELFLEGFTFDYAHFLPFDPKCSRLHGHTSNLSARIKGKTDTQGLLMHFSLAKKCIKSVLEQFDHKLIVASKYIVEKTNNEVLIVYTTTFKKIGENPKNASKSKPIYKIRLPYESLLEIPTESTIESISKQLGEKILDRLPENISSIELKVCEGSSKGAYVNLTR